MPESPAGGAVERNMRATILLRSSPVIVDAHVHIHPKKEGLGARFDASLDGLIRSLDASPVDRAVLLPIEPEIPNVFVAEAVSKYPDKLVAFASVNPLAEEHPAEELERVVERYGFRGLKLHPRRQALGVEQAEQVARVVQKAAHLGIPVVFDAFPYGGRALRDMTLELIERVAEMAPEASIIIAHMGGHRLFEALTLARSSENIYFDTSLILARYKGSSLEHDIFYAIKKLGPDRCIYGSDYPDVELGESYVLMREHLDEHGFSDDEQAEIFGGAIAKLIGLY
jgi:predicted TIM-barrel fold metal-dependent hydrolase